MSKRYPKARTMREATCWLFITAVNEHIMRCETARFPDENPPCEGCCCPNCCGTCSTLKWFRDSADHAATNMLNKYDSGQHPWQTADGSVDWSQIEAHWDDSGMTCARERCLQADAKRLDMEPWTEEALAGWTGP